MINIYFGFYHTRLVLWSLASIPKFSHRFKIKLLRIQLFILHYINSIDKKKKKEREEDEEKNISLNMFCLRTHCEQLYKFKVQIIDLMRFESLLKKFWYLLYKFWYLPLMHPVWSWISSDSVLEAWFSRYLYYTRDQRHNSDKYVSRRLIVPMRPFNNN